MLNESIINLYKKFRLVHYKNLFGRIKEREGSLSATEAYAVDVIYLLNKPTIKQFSEYICISQPNATYKINSLISKGYITREPSEEDKREFKLCPAKKFYDYYDAGNNFISDAIEKLRSEYTEEEIKLFEKMLVTFNDSVE